MAATKKTNGAVPARRLTKEELVKTHATHLKKQNTSPNAPRPVKQPVMSDAYPASTKSIRELEIIPLNELQPETHHRGKGIIVRAVSPPFLGAGAVSIVEDQFGNADKLAIYNQPDSSILSAVPEGCVVAVKEPYYKNNGAAGDYMICVDHPSDVILLRFTDPIIPEALRLGPLLKTADEWKNAGDRAFIEKDFPTAVFCYTEALEAAADDAAFQAAIYAKRAGTNLILGRYDAAKADALASRTGGPQDWKAYFTAGRAAYGLCNYAESNTLLTTALDLQPSNPAIQKEHARCQARLREEATGEYDFAAMHASLGGGVHLDRGSYLRHTRVAPSRHHGRGLFATRDFAAGELVFAEKATLMPNQYEPARASAALFALVVRQLCDNPSLARPVLALHAGEAADAVRTGMEGAVVDGVPVVDVFVVEGIRTKNCFSAPRSTLEDTRPSVPEGWAAKGLWVHASRMNHSCVPNTMRSFVGDMLISRATRDIKEGEELFQQYVPVKALPDVRNEQFKKGWGFECECALCASERRSPEAMLAKRKELLAAVEKLCNKKLPGKELVPDATIRAVDRLAKQLEDAHEPDVYEGVPRLTLIYPCNWLVAAHRGRKNHAKVVKYALKVLRNFGFKVPEENEVWDPREMYAKSGDATLMTVHVVAALRTLAEAYKALGHDEMAERCIEAAEFGYMIVTGSKNDLTTLDK
ncbi:b948e930-a345-4c23-a8e7-80127fed34cc [Thermothielavioides terrestris]|uniref:B948e930-a345-4c23-a8e7-80127fed34cc n=1 Tax=Thermothielavioides terrestris TaxID=2587410 RepID=A0A446B7H2_9PEZI|nr:b948e930-a345-4c23-a8e7-80127fed34cc [Thermothielavioides terrestris]